MELERYICYVSIIRFQVISGLYGRYGIYGRLMHNVFLIGLYKNHV